jgi:hypothetical protein
VLIVAEAGLGTLNHTALTLEALAAKGVSCAGLVIGSWPATRARRRSQPRCAGPAGPVRAALPAGVATVSATDFALFRPGRSTRPGPPVCSGAFDRAVLDEDDAAIQRVAAPLSDAGCPASCE